MPQREWYAWGYVVIYGKDDGKYIYLHSQYKDWINKKKDSLNLLSNNRDDA